jgi:hypothetical protein
MFDLGECPLGNVRIDRDLRRRRNDGGNRGGSNVGDVNIGRNVDVVGNIGDIGNVDNLGDDGNVRIVGNVRFRLEQHGFIVGANIAHNAGRRCSNGTSVGICRGRQSGGQLCSCGTNDERIAQCVYDGAGTNHAHHYLCAHCFIYDDKLFPVPNWQHRCGRLLKLPFNRELDGP